MADETGKTVEATLRILIDDADAKRKKRELTKDFEEIYKSAAMNNWRMENRVARQRDAAEERRVKKQLHEEEMAHRRTLSYTVRQQRREEHELDLNRRRSLALNVREGRKAKREEQLENERIERMNEASHRRSLALRVREGRKAIEETERAAQRQTSARGSLAMQSLALMQMGGVAGRIGQAQTFGNLATTAGYGRLGSHLTSNAVPYGVAAAGGLALWGGIKAGARAEVNQWADNRQQGSLALQGMFPNVYDTITLLNGTQRENARANVAGDIGGMRLGGQVSANIAGRDARRISDSYFLRNEAYKNYNVVGLPTADRTSALGRVQFGEQVRQQPLLQAQRKAEVELHSARMNVVSATKLANETEKEYNAELRKGQGLWKIAMNMPGGIGSGADANAQKTLTLAEANNSYKAADRLRGELQQRRLEQQKLEGAAVSAEQGLRTATIATKRGELSNLMAREEHATGQATALGGMGPGGRMKGELALQMISENGIDYATPDMIAAAESVAPMTVQNMKRALGERYAGSSEILKKYAPEDYALYGSAESLRQQVNDVRSGIAEMEVGSEKQTAEQFAQVYGLEWANLMMNVALQTAKAQIEQYKLSGMMGVQNQVSGGTK